MIDSLDLPWQSDLEPFVTADSTAASADNGDAGQQAKQFTPSHSITLSAEASKVSGTASASAFAVFMLSDSSNLEAW